MRLKIASLLLIAGLSVAAFVYDKVDPITDVHLVKESSIMATDNDGSEVGFVQPDRVPRIQSPILPVRAADRAVDVDRALASKSLQIVGLLENELRLVRDTATAYLMLIDALKNEVHLKEQELRKLQSTVESYASQVATLTTNLAPENATFNTRDVVEGVDGKRFDATDGGAIEQVDYFTVAKRVEASARKIRSAELKREHLLEALEVYKKAFSLGRTEAAHNIAELEQILFPSSALADTK